jgi:hypothetical protein
MTKVNIFENENAQPLMGEFFAFDKVGAAIQGTYVDQREGTDTFGNEQNIYVIIDDNDKVWNCGFRKTSVTGQIIADRMEKAEYGVIVGFRFDGEKPSKVKPGVMAKVINCYFDPKVVDTDWVARRKTVAAAEAAASADGQKASDDFDNFGKDIPFSAPTDAGASTVGAPTTNEKPRNEAVDAIRQLARTKGLTNDTMSEADADKVIEQYAEFPLTEENLTKIIIKLTGYVSK